MARFCEYCGCKNDEDSAFCSQCGKELRNMEKAPPGQPVPVSEPVHSKPIQRTPAYSDPVSQAPAYYTPSQAPRRPGKTGLIIGVAAFAIIAAAVVLILVLKPFGGGAKNTESLIDPYTVFAQVGDDYMALLPEKPGPIVPGEPLPTAAPYEPGPQIESDTYYCEYLEFTMEPYSGWYSDESALYSDNMVTFSKDDNSPLLVMYSSDTTSADFEADPQSFADSFTDGTSAEVTDYGWEATLQGYATYYLFFSTYDGSREDLYCYTFVIDGGYEDSYIFIFIQDANNAVLEDAEEALAMINTFKMA